MSPSVKNKNKNSRLSGKIHIRKAKNERREYELETGSFRSRSFGCGSHQGKPIFGHDGNEKRDQVATLIGKKTKEKKREKYSKN